MKRLFALLISLSIVAILLLFFASCGEKDPPLKDSDTATEEKTEATTSMTEDVSSDSAPAESTQSTESASFEEKTTEETEAASTEKETESEMIEEYTDQSSITSPIIEIDKQNYATVTSSPDGKANSSLVFDGSEQLKISALGISGIHDTASCSKCGFKEKDGVTAYYICENSQHQGGFTLTLTEPIPAKLFSGMTVTYTSSANITTSQIRILSISGTRNDSFINECPSMAGAVGEWKTVDLGMTESDVNALSDGDGYIRAFKLYFRDKNNTDIHIKSIDFTVSYDKLCRVDAITENCFYRGGAVSFVANEIASRLSDLGIKADVTVKATGYTQNTPEKTGKLSYTATLVFSDGEEFSVKGLNTNIYPIRNTWLERADSPYGAMTDAKGQWTDRFDRAGLIYLENNTFDGIDDLKTVEYAVIEANREITDENIFWCAPQILKIEGNSFSLYANAFLDHGSTLTTGKEYRFVVRAVTSSDNYLLHLDIPFTYEPIDSELEAKLSSLSADLWAHAYSFDSGEGVAEKLKEKIESQIDVENVSVNVEEATMGISRASFIVRLTYTGKPETDRFPIRPSDTLYAYDGEWFSFKCLTIFDEIESPFNLISPEDGARDVIIASEAVVNHMNADLDYLISSAYPFAKNESCLPTAVKFEWHTKSDDEEYTLLISESIDMSDPLVFTTSTIEQDYYVSISVSNLKAGTTYYWQVKAGDQVSNMACFTTADYPRFILTENVSNFRDIGGYKTLDGYRVKQGLAFRSANLDSVNSSDKEIIKNFLGIKTDLDLRGQSSYSPLGRDIKMLRVSIQWYTGVFAQEQHLAFRRAIAQFAVEDNYPMVYHCQIGRDRTGTVTTTILALLGVDEETLIREYMLSFNSVGGNADGVPGYQMVVNIKNYINGLKAYGDPDATLAEHTEAFLLEIGVTAEEIQAIKDILLEK